MIIATLFLENDRLDILFDVNHTILVHATF